MRSAAACWLIVERQKVKSIESQWHTTAQQYKRRQYRTLSNIRMGYFCIFRNEAISVLW